MSGFSSAALLEAITVIAGLDDVTAVREPIEEGDTSCILSTADFIDISLR